MPISDLLAQINGEPQTSVATSKPILKRKADADLERPRDKPLQRERLVANVPMGEDHTKRTSSKLVTATTSASVRGKPKPQRTNQPTSRDDMSSITPPPTEPGKPPKKGSYAEILARGKAAQAVLGKVGKIQHRPVEKSLSKRERQELKEREMGLQRGLKRKSSSNVGNGVQKTKNEAGESKRKESNKTPPILEKKVKKAALATTGYAGTARPTPAANSKKPSAASSSTNGQHRYGAPTSSNSFAYRSEDEVEDDEDDEDEEDYGSDVSSDMEAAVFEVDEEEERASRIARKEDEAAAREEAHLKREKEEKRRKLMALAKSRR